MKCSRKKQLNIEARRSRHAIENGDYAELLGGKTKSKKKKKKKDLLSFTKGDKKFRLNSKGGFEIVSKKKKKKKKKKGFDIKKLIKNPIAIASAAGLGLMLMKK